MTAADDGDEIVRAWIMSGRYLPTKDDCRRQPWMGKAYADLLYKLSGNGQYYGAFCEVCHTDDTHRPDCYIAKSLR